MEDRRVCESSKHRLPSRAGFGRRLGWSAPNLTEAEALKLWDIVEIGLGGYVIGRTAEKVLPGLVGSLKRG
ncbi:MAG: hypothetical protein KAW67_03525 [Candidatus Eisenbacteria sp.]|nr:hypothetical protein [Candidatus Eisenbacteria bacterium]